jgi:hypothetical protein
LSTPQEWLEEEWARRHAMLPALDALLRGGRMVPLLDAVNENPHQDEADYREGITLWRDFLAELTRRVPGTQALFSCRSLNVMKEDRMEVDPEYVLRYDIKRWLDDEDGR